MSTADYITEGERQISDVKSYSLLDKDHTQDYLEQVNQAIEALNIDPKVKGTLTPAQPTCPNIYFLPKFHKENNPGRPIVSGCACPTVEISKFLDVHLSLLVENLPFTYWPCMCVGSISRASKTHGTREVLGSILGRQLDDLEDI